MEGGALVRTSSEELLAGALKSLSTIGQFVPLGTESGDEEAVLERCSAAAEKLVKWRSGMLRLRRSAITLMSALPALQKISKLPGAITESPETAMELVGGSSMLDHATKFLASLPRDPILIKSNPRDARSARALLTAALVAVQPAAVLSEGAAAEEGGAMSVQDMSEEGKHLACSSRLVVCSIDRLARCVVSLDRGRDVSPRGAALLEYRRALVILRFARRYHAASFRAWRAVDAGRAAAQLIAPYAEAFSAARAAAKANDAATAAAAEAACGELRLAIEQLLGAAAAGEALQEVEAAVQAQLEAAWAAMPPPPPPKEAEAAAVAAAGGEATGGGGAGGGAGGGSTAAAAMASKMNMNEALVHELILDSRYQLPPIDDDSLEISDSQVAKSAAGVPERERERVEATMRAVFWDRLLASLQVTNGGKRPSV